MSVTHGFKDNTEFPRSCPSFWVTDRGGGGGLAEEEDRRGLRLYIRVVWELMYSKLSGEASKLIGYFFYIPVPPRLGSADRVGKCIYMLNRGRLHQT